MRLGTCLLVCTAISATARADVVTDWNIELLDAVRATSTPPPKASRAMAMVSGAVYDAVNAIDGTHQPYVASLNASPTASREAAAAQAARDVLVSLYPARQTAFDARLATHLKAIPGSTARAAGIALGGNAANQMIAARIYDGSSTIVPYTPGTQPGDWRPTAPGNQPALLPNWPAVTPFTMTRGGQFRPAGPPALTSATYTQDYEEVRALGSLNSATRTADQTEIARFWADGAGTETPPGHWNTIARTVGEARGQSISENARMLALLNLSLADAAIVSWDCKYENDFWRPITAIQEGDTDGNSLTVDDDAWTSLLVTPPFPECTSGHSTFSGSAAAVLASFFGTDAIAFETGSDPLPGVMRDFDGFWSAAEEAGRSRIYGGIHFEFSNQQGLSSGAQLGDYVASNFLTVVPEPTSLAILALGVSALLRRKR